MADRRYEDEQRRDTSRRWDPDTERRIERRADRSRDEERFGRDERDQYVLRYADDRGARGPSPSGAFHDHSHLAGLYDLEDPRELRERYREYYRQRDYQPRYGHGPGVENMEAPRLGYSTSTTRGADHELGHGGFLGAGSYRSRAPVPTGRAPKGYQRSDDRIREDVCDRLMYSPYDASDVEINVANGEVTLMGIVRRRADKWGIEDVAESVLGVHDVHNQIRINRDEAPAPELSTDDPERLHS